MTDPTVCKCCGQTLPVIRPFDLDFTRTERQIVNIVQKAGQHGISFERLFDKLYGHREDGGPENRNVISVFVAKINKKLALVGKEIRSPVGGCNSAYRIQDLTRAQRASRLSGISKAVGKRHSLFAARNG